MFEEARITVDELKGLIEKNYPEADFLPIGLTMDIRDKQHIATLKFLVEFLSKHGSWGDGWCDLVVDWKGIRRAVGLPEVEEG